MKSLQGAFWEENAQPALTGERFQLTSGAHSTECDGILAFTTLSNEGQAIQQAIRVPMGNVLEVCRGRVRERRGPALREA